MIKTLTCLLGAAALSATATAQVLVLGSGLGKDCYDAVVTRPAPTAVDERACTRAINSGTLDQRNLTATYINRGIIRMRMEKFDASLEDYAEAKELRPDLGAIYLNEGAALIGMGDPSAGKAALEKSLELDTQDPQIAHFNLGLANEMLDDAQAAYFSYRKALELEPDWELPQRELSRFSVNAAES
ncbi:MAG: tetratricopeptide repeat protein [Pseudomonadota bacterium]